jgi:hypothetical protein
MIKTKVFHGACAVYSSNDVAEIATVGEPLEQQIQAWLEERQRDGKKIEIVTATQSSSSGGTTVTIVTILYKEL